MLLRISLTQCQLKATKIVLKTETWLDYTGNTHQNNNDVIQHLVRFYRPNNKHHIIHKVKNIYC